jgi:hypothetical protein
LDAEGDDPALEHALNTSVQTNATAEKRMVRREAAMEYPRYSVCSAGTEWTIAADGSRICAAPRVHNSAKDPSMREAVDRGGCDCAQVYTVELRDSRILAQP